MKIIIGHLYGDLMNIYGDRGNVICVSERAKWRRIKIEIKNISLKDKLRPGSIDIFFFGGGQDQAQEEVSRDLVKSDKGKVIKKEVERGVPLLSICGGYQLLGDYYKPHKGPKLEGVGLFPAYTLASFERMIGNIVIETQNLNPIKSDSNIKCQTVGFENHSGKTYLKKGAQPLGKVIKGFGNNGFDKTEGCVYKNAIGTYLHGSLLPKNPQLADWLLQKALEVKYGKKIELQSLDDTLELKAHNKLLI